MPFVGALRETEEENDEGLPTLTEDMHLHFPSVMTGDLADQCSVLRKMEYRLRYSQCDDALAEVRRLRRVLKNVKYFKNKNITGTGGKAMEKIAFPTARNTTISIA